MAELHGMHSLALFPAAVAGLAIAHRAVLWLPTGLPRLVFILPILPIFFMLPWTIPIYHLRAILSFIFLWTVPSKLLLLCWDAGIDYPSSGFLYFATIVMLPIRVRGKKAKKQAHPSTHNGQFWCQFIAVIVILNIYSYRNGLPLWAIYVLYACHIYLGLELMLGGLAKLATACFGVESDPQFNNPFMSASLSEFWGRRWNLVVTTILRSTVYNPALLLLMRAEKQKGQQSRIQEALNNPAPLSTDLSPDISCAPEFEPQLAQEGVNSGTNYNPHATHCAGSLAASVKNHSANESESPNQSSSEQASSENGPHCSEDQTLSGHAIHAEPLHTDHNGHSLNLLKSDVNPNPEIILHPSPHSKVERLMAENCIKGREIPSAGVAATANGCHHNPMSNINPVRSAPNPNTDCHPEPSPILSSCHLDPDPISSISPLNNDPNLPDCNPNPNLLDYGPRLNITECSTSHNPNPDLTECCPDPKLLAYNHDPLLPNPIPDLDGAKNGMLRGTTKSSLRARAVAVLARAATKTNLINPDLFAKSDTYPTANPNPELHPTMYKIATEEKGGSREKPSLRAKAVAMLVTFAVSGLVHELIFYYINKSRATGEVTAFFILHGCATAMEVLLKKTMLAQVRLPRPLSIALTLAFLYATAAWLFMPPLTRNGADLNTIAEYQRLQSALISLFVKR